MIFWGTKWFLNIDKLKGKSLLEINWTSSLRDMLRRENGKKNTIFWKRTESEGEGNKEK